MFDYLVTTYEFFSDVLYNLMYKFVDNKTLLWFVVAPVVITCIFLIIDFIFELSDRGVGIFHLGLVKGSSMPNSYANSKYKGYSINYTKLAKKTGSKFGKDYKETRIELEKMQKEANKNIKTSSSKYPIPLRSVKNYKSVNSRKTNSNIDIDYED